jgi:hypothetical protein
MQKRKVMENELGSVNGRFNRLGKNQLFDDHLRIYNLLRVWKAIPKLSFAF